MFWKLNNKMEPQQKLYENFSLSISGTNGWWTIGGLVILASLLTAL
jgi:hypothetical protein